MFIWNRITQLSISGLLLHLKIISIIAMGSIHLILWTKKSNRVKHTNNYVTSKLTKLKNKYTERKSISIIPPSIHDISPHTNINLFFCWCAPTFLALRIKAAARRLTSLFYLFQATERREAGLALHTGPTALSSTQSKICPHFHSPIHCRLYGH